MRTFRQSIAKGKPATRRSRVKPRREITPSPELREISQSDQDFAKLLNDGYIDDVDSKKRALAELVKEQYNVDIKTALRFAGQIHTALLIEGNVRKRNRSDNLDISDVEKRFNTLLKNPPLYREREHRNEKPTEFYKRVWHEFAHYGLLYQDQLREIDEQLISRVRHYCAVNHLKASNFLPPPRQVRTQREAAFGDPKAIARLIATERLKAYRPK